MQDICWIKNSKYYISIFQSLQPGIDPYPLLRSLRPRVGEVDIPNSVRKRGMNAATHQLAGPSYLLPALVWPLN